MKNMIKRFWYNWKIQRLKSSNNLNFEAMRMAKIPHDIIQKTILMQALKESTPSTQPPGFPEIHNK